MPLKFSEFFIPPQIRQNGDRDSSEQVTAAFGLIVAEAAKVFARCKFQRNELFNRAVARYSRSL